ncbi:MAG: TolC family protein [Bacteroidales bacterium]|nr:TolC family protein [Bacteroidales bacterium]
MARLNQNILMILVMLIPVNGFSQQDSVSRLSLIQAQNIAVENFYLTVNAKMDILAAKKKIKETTAIGLPQVNGGVDYTYTPEIPTANFGAIFLDNSLPETSDFVTGQDIHNNLALGYTDNIIQLGVKQNISYNVMLTQLIFSGEYIVGLQASRTYLKLSEEAYEKATIELKQLVANSYYTILVLDENKKLLSEAVSNLEAVYEETRKIAGQGMIESTEADQIEISVKRLDNQLKSVERQFEFMVKMLKYQLGLSIDAGLELTDNLNQLVDINILGLNNLPDFNLNDHIDFKLLNTQEELNLLSLKREKSTYLPSLSGFYKYEDKFKKADFDFTMRHMIGVSMSVPIFSSGSKSAKVGQARIELEKSQLQKTQEAERLTMEAMQARFDYQNALEKFNNEKANYELSERIFKNTSIKFKEGMVSSMDLTLANNQLIEAQLSYSQAILELLNNKVELDKAYSKL